MRPHQCDLRRPLQCTTVGAPALLISRTALLAIVEAGTARPYRRQVSGGNVVADTAGWGFFDPVITEDGTALAADDAFCARWRATGGDLWVDLAGEFGTALTVATRSRT